MSEVEEIRRQTWFHGSITRHTAEQRLQQCQVGTYLFRESETRPGFSLSLKVPDKVKHFMISQREGTGLWYLVGKQKDFTTMFELIDYHGTTQTNQSDGTCLLFPCPANTDEENPYVDLLNNVEVNQEALDAARRLSEERRTQSGGGKTKPAQKVHRYEHVTLGGSVVPEE